MCRPKEREQMVLTDRVKGNGSNGDESVRLLRQHIRPEILRTRMQPCKKLRVERSRTRRSFLHSLHRKINADRR